MKKFALILLTSAISLPIYAEAIPQLKSFLAGSKTLSASFTQVVSSKNKREETSGLLEISRPGKFNWAYTKPTETLIIGDGKTLWVYDKSLAQVTRKSLNSALGSSPAALLAGNDTIEKNYQLKEAGKQGDVEWLAASPKKTDNTFNTIRMGFKNNMLVEMELTDAFGNQTRITFSNQQKNPKLGANHFSFTPPKGVDVLDAD